MRIGYTKLDKPTNYYRSGVTADDFRLVMEGVGWLTLSQVVAMVSHKIAPEAKVRHFQLRQGVGGLQHAIAQGERDIVRARLRTLVYHGKVEKHGSGKESKFRWIEKTPEAGQDSA